MKDLLSKEHYCYKIYNEKQWLPPTIDNPLYGLPPPPILSEVQTMKNFEIAYVHIRIKLK